MVKFAENYWKPIIVSIFIMILSFGNFSSLNELPKVKGEDKIIHVLMYAALGFFLAFDFKRQHVKSVFGLNSDIFIVFYIAIFGGIIELFQKYFFPPRTAEWIDWLGDIAGAFIGILLVKYFYKKNG